jgi:hypothetical protein
MGELCAARDNQPHCAKYRGCVSSWRNKLYKKEYRDKKNAGLKGDFYVLQQMQQTQNKTAKQHRETTRQLIMPFF